MYCISPKTCAWPHGLGGDGMTGTIYDDLFEIQVGDGRLVASDFVYHNEFDETGRVVTKRRVDKQTPSYGWATATTPYSSTGRATP